MELKIASKSYLRTDPYFTIQKLHHDGTNPILVRKRYVIYLGMRYEAKNHLLWKTMRIRSDPLFPAKSSSQP
jgi:hypothetical protein